MTFFLLTAALVTAGVGIWLSRRWRVLGQLIMVLGGLGLLGAVALEIRQYVLSPEPKPPDRSQMAVSYCLATCVLADTAGESGSVVLLFPQRHLMDADTERSYEEGFAPPLRHGHGMLHLKALRLEGKDREAARSLQSFRQVLTQAQGALAVVSYAALPADLDSLFSPGQPKVPPLYLFDPNGTTNWLGALKAGHIKAVVVPRPGMDSRARATIAGMPDKVFERCYLLATSANADAIAASLKPPR